MTDPTPVPDPHLDRRRQQIGADLAHTVLAATARRLAEAVADFETGLDDRVRMAELQFLDQQVDAARRAHEAAGGRPEVEESRHPDEHARHPGRPGARA